MNLKFCIKGIKGTIKLRTGLELVVLVCDVVDVSASVDSWFVTLSVGSIVGSEVTVGLSPLPVGAVGLSPSGGGFGGFELSEPLTGSLIGGQVSINKNLMHFGK
jgi:hypothetical protein